MLTRLGRVIVRNCPPAERAARESMEKLGRFLTMQDLRDRGGRLASTVSEGRGILASIRSQRIVLERRLADARALPPALSPFDNAAFVFRAARAGLRIQRFRLMERLLARVIEHKLAEAHRLNIPVE